MKEAAARAARARRVRGRTVACALLATLLLVAAPAARADRRPNVVLIVVDDLARDDIPHLDRLEDMVFRAGTEFRRFAAPDALCGPSRVSILRGQYSHNTGVTTNKRVFATTHALGLESSTIATWLQSDGYATALFGKYLNEYGRKNDPLGATYVPPGWTEWYGGIPGFGFWLNHNGSVVRYPEDGPHANDVLADLAVSFIARNADRPMFLYVAPGSAHGDAPPAHRHENAFADAVLPQNPAFNEEDVSDKPAWIRRITKPLPPDQPRRLERYRNRLRSMLSVEDLIASILRELRVRGVLKNTYVVFLSDNGFHYGEHRIKASKATAYDESLLVPAAIRGPGVPAGVALDHLVTNGDLAVTIADLAGVTVPDFVDGRSLVPLLRADRPSAGEWRRAIGIEHVDPRAKGDGPSPSFHGVLLNQWKYVRYPVTDEEELYDRVADPYELQSLHAAGHDACRSALRAWADELLACSGRECRALERDQVESPRRLACTRGAPALSAAAPALDEPLWPLAAAAVDESACTRP